MLAGGDKSSQTRDVKQAQKVLEQLEFESWALPRSNRCFFRSTQSAIDDAAIAEYMTAVLETEDTDLLLLALGDVARAKGMAQVAKDAGLGRESLYKALTPGAKPRLDTILKVTRALSVKLAAHPA